MRKIIKKYMRQIALATAIVAFSQTALACASSQASIPITINKNIKTFGDQDGLNSYADQTTSLGNPNNRNEYLERKYSGQPYSLHYHSRDLMAWNPDKDIDSAFNRGTVLLKDRENAARILSSQVNKELTILATLNRTTSNNKVSTLARNTIDGRVFNMWAQISNMVTWGGAASEGNYILPKGDDINVAHKNGVPIFATLFMPPQVFGGTVDQYQDMVAKVDGRYPVADSMVKMAKYYRFDGWFLNLETTGVSNELGQKIGAFISYLYQKMQKENLFLMLYDYGIGQNYYQDGNFDQAMIDFHNRHQTYNLPSHKFSFGYNYDVGQFTSKDEGGPWKWDGNNLWIYTYFRHHDPVVDGDQTDLMFFADSQKSRDPRAVGTDAFTEMGKNFLAKTTLLGRNPFATTFEKGFGSSYYIDGIKQKLAFDQEGYRNNGLQDYLPTYMYINDYYDQNQNQISTPGEIIMVENTPWKVTIDEKQPAWYGSHNLHYTGKIAPGHTMENKLFGANIILQSHDEFTVIARGEADLQLILWLEDNDNNELTHTKIIITPSQIKALANDFNEYKFLIGDDLNQKNVKQFGLALGNKQMQTINIDDYIGQLSFTPHDDKDVDENVLTEFNHDGDFINQKARYLRINWSMDDVTTIDHYVVYEADEEFNRQAISAIVALPAAYLKNVPNQATINYIIEARDINHKIVSTNRVTAKTSFGSMSDLSKWNVKWSRPNDLEQKWLVTTENGYTTTFVDKDGAVYVGDNYTRVHKITSKGDFKSNGSASWGIKLLGKDSKDTDIIKIFNYSPQTIGIITAKGSWHILDKNTGQQLNQDHNLINKFLNKEKINTTDDHPLHHRLLKITMAAKTTQGQMIIFDVQNGKNTTTMQVIITPSKIQRVVLPSQFKLDYIATTKAGYVITFFYQKSLFLQILDELDWSAIDVNQAIAIGNQIASSTSHDDFIKQMNASKSEFYDQQSRDEISTLFAQGKTMNISSNGQTIFVVNEWGLLTTVDYQTKSSTTASLVSVQQWQQLLESEYVETIPMATSLHAIMKIVKFKLNGGQQTIVDNIMFDALEQSFTFTLMTPWTKAWWGHANINQLIVKSKILNQKTTPQQFLFIPPQTIIALSQDEDKKVGKVIFINKIKNIYIVGGSHGRIAIFDLNFKQIPLGRKSYQYNDRIVTVVEKIINDNDDTIPAYLLG